ncbi:MAG: ferric reductase-like transmembrane domain-containing protein [Hyphomicrobiales bacterium]|nr:ferric reductase-like transmembrane domain-containing protein [Hyphomicrobiales bacterium]
MSAKFQMVQWNRTKIIYDVIAVTLVAAYVYGFMIAMRSGYPPAKAPAWADLRISAFGTAAFLLISIILSIGPLARLNKAFLPLLYNRRHLGVLAFIVAAIHAYAVLDWFIIRGSVPWIWHEITNVKDYAKFVGFPMKAIGLFCLIVFFVMAATSHDYWQKVLSPGVWKAIHMSIYIAYGLLVMHVALGLMQRDYSVYIPVSLGIVATTVIILHLAASFGEIAGDRTDRSAALPGGWIEVGAPVQIPEKRARIVTAPGGERIAVFRDGKTVSAVTNACAHQNGPLGEGRIVDGCITCPWHGFQYRPEDGCSPPPFTEKVATYNLRLENGLVLLDPRPNARGQRVEPLSVAEARA